MRKQQTKLHAGVPRALAAANSHPAGFARMFIFVSLFASSIIAGHSSGAASIINRSGECRERQITTAAQDHVLTNVNAWSRDNRWIAYDIRSGDGAAFNGTRIEMVDVQNGAVKLLYQSRNNAGCGVVTFSPADDQVAFIIGPENPTPEWDYAFSRRRGMIVNIHNPGTGHPMDAMNYSPPFAPGALRGGSHVHVFSADGKRISFTYDDEILSRMDEAEKAKANVLDHRQYNQRNIGVAAAGNPVHVNRNHPRNNDGEWFSVLVSRTVNNPKPGSDEISRAFEEGWIGDNGYIRADGTRQHRALAFQGMVTATDGRQHAEVYIVDLPENLTRSSGEPLEGDLLYRPSPPAGVTQRRLTFTGAQKYPGVSPVPRHWLRSSPDGAAIAFLMKDDNGTVQLWTVSPLGGTPRQVTRLTAGVASAFTWSPDGKLLAAVIDGSICTIEASTGRVYRLTSKKTAPDAPDAAACVFSPDGSKIAYHRKITQKNGTFRQIYIVELPDH